MNYSMFLAGVLGIAMVTKALFVLLRPEEVNNMLKGYAKDQGTVSILGFFALILGLFLSLSHNLWVADFRLFVTMISWLVLLKGVFAIFYPKKFMEMARSYTDRNHQLIVSLVTFALGVYLFSIAYQF